MAVSISNAFVTLFDSEVKQAYQGQRLLAGVTRERAGVEGSTVKFPKIGKGSATIRVPQTDVTPLNVSYSQVTATMEDYIAAEYSDIFNQQKVNFNERQELVQVVSGAIARRMDQIVLMHLMRLLLLSLWLTALAAQQQTSTSRSCAKRRSCSTAKTYRWKVVQS